MNWLGGDQLRELLGGTFRGLRRDTDAWTVRLGLPGGGPVEISRPGPAEAYGEALLRLIRLGTD
ncbi:hypothetical protein V6U90_06745 [Micromonospora sp. CPCC 206060]|uniref:hypothetical protein n=1 Tax=Micromonospora sp. CPCC 206060 TaxID=3122406 RepID=UPI002FF32A07